MEKHGRAFDAAAERALLVNHFVAERRDVAEADVPADHVSRKCDDLVAHQRSLGDLAAKLAAAIAGEDAPATPSGARGAKSATFQSPVVALLDQPSLVSALTDPRDPTPAGAAPPAIQEELDVLSVVSAGSQRTVVTHDGDAPPPGCKRLPFLSFF